ncbi:MAG: ABC transporter substrate-binding protein, partial [Ignavibacteriales bacterium]|nr:ABC transporter substrate-binding protein [Ignavibacteriales bacterium]
GLKNVAILASSESIGRALAESINREVKRLGGNVIAFEYYARESSDLSEQFINIRNAGFKLAGRKEEGDDTQVPLYAIDGLFIAIADADEIGVIASQIKYFNIETHLLGSNEWYAPSQLESNKRYLNGLIFPTDSFQDEGDPLYQEFDRIYFSINKKHPTKYSLIGYDTMHLLLDRIKEDVDTREKRIRALDAVESFPGLHGKITFTNGRVNSEMQILQFNNGEIQKVAELSIE